MTKFHNPMLIAKDAFSQGVDLDSTQADIEAWIAEQVPDVSAPGVMAVLVRIEIEINREAWLDEPMHANTSITLRQFREDMAASNGDGWKEVKPNLAAAIADRLFGSEMSLNDPDEQMPPLDLLLINMGIPKAMETARQHFAEGKTVVMTETILVDGKPRVVVVPEDKWRA